MTSRYRLAQISTASIIKVGCFVLLFLATFHVNGSIPVTSMLEGYSTLDASWQLVLEYAAGHSLQVGKDIQYAYGPLGYLFNEVSSGQMFPQRVLFAFGWSLYVAWAATGVAWELPPRPRYLFLAWILLFCTVREGADPLGFLIILYGGHLCINRIGSKIAVAAFIAFIALITLIKFQFFIASMVVFVTASALQAANRQYLRSVTILTAYPLLFGLFWAATGNPIANIPSWIRWSLELSSGYSKALSRPPDPAILALCLISALIFLLACGAGIKKDTTLTARTGYYFLLLVFSLMAWKHGFVRAHTSPYALFQPIAFAMLYLKPFSRSSATDNDSRSPILFLIVFLLCAGSLVILSNGAICRSILSKPLNAFDRLKTVTMILAGNTVQVNPAQHADKNLLGKFDLPAARTIIGSATVDVFDNQEWTAILNNLNYHPRPVMQGFMACTPSLQDLNRAYFESSKRAEFIILNIETVDNRFPMLNDATVLPILLRDYHIVGREKEFMILQDLKKDYKPLQLTLIHEQSVGFDDWVNLSPYKNAPYVIKVDIRPTFWGNLVNAIYHTPVLSMNLVVGKEILENRIVPSIAAAGFLLNPLIFDNNDFTNFYQNAGVSAEAIAFKRPSTAVGQFAETIGVKIYRLASQRRDETYRQ